MKLRPLARCIVVLTATALVVVIAAPACSINSEDCDDDNRDDSCGGTFSCANAGNAFSCQKATETCVQKPGFAMCVTIPGASTGHCPTKPEALSVAGCQMGAGTTGGNAPKCRGASEDGITVICHI